MELKSEKNYITKLFCYFNKNLILMLPLIYFTEWHNQTHICCCTYYILSPYKVDFLSEDKCPHMLINIWQTFCLSWDSSQEIDSSWTLFIHRDAAPIRSRLDTGHLSSVLCKRSHALTYRIWIGWREDRLLNKWPLSGRRRQPLMSLSPRFGTARVKVMVRKTSAPKPVLHVSKL